MATNLMFQTQGSSSGKIMLKLGKLHLEISTSLLLCSVSFWKQVSCDVYTCTYQGCHRGGAGVLQGFQNGVTGVSQGCRKGVTGVSHGCHMGCRRDVAGMSQGCRRDVTGVSQECHRGVALPTAKWQVGTRTCYNLRTKMSSCFVNLLTI